MSEAFNQALRELIDAALTGVPNNKTLGHKAEAVFKLMVDGAPPYAPLPLPLQHLIHCAQLHPKDSANPQNRMNSIHEAALACTNYVDIKPCPFCNSPGEFVEGSPRLARCTNPRCKLYADSPFTLSEWQNRVGHD